MQTGVLVQRQTIPSGPGGCWSERSCSGRSRSPSTGPRASGAGASRSRDGCCGRSSCAVPFLIAAVFARLLGLLGALPSAPAAPAMSGALPFNGLAARSVAATLLVLGLAWALWPPGPAGWG